jgi:hypothetical protein
MHENPASKALSEGGRRECQFSVVGLVVAVPVDSPVPSALTCAWSRHRSRDIANPSAGYHSMNPEYREKLLAVLAKLDQLVTDADSVLAGPGDVEIYASMEDIREHLVEMRARVEAKLDRLAL